MLITEYNLSHTFFNFKEVKKMKLFYYISLRMYNELLRSKNLFPAYPIPR